jgi:hypothetical protein
MFTSGGVPLGGLPNLAEVFPAIRTGAPEKDNVRELFLGLMAKGPFTTITDLFASRAPTASSEKQYGDADVPFPGFVVEHNALFCK